MGMEKSERAIKVLASQCAKDLSIYPCWACTLATVQIFDYINVDYHVNLIFFIHPFILMALLVHRHGFTIQWLSGKKRHFNQNARTCVRVVENPVATEANTNISWKTKTIMGLRAWFDNEAANWKSHSIWFVKNTQLSGSLNTFEALFFSMHTKSDRATEIRWLNGNLVSHEILNRSKMSAENLIKGWAMHCALSMEHMDVWTTHVELLIFIIRNTFKASNRTDLWFVLFQNEIECLATEWINYIFKRVDYFFAERSKYGCRIFRSFHKAKMFVK